MLLDIHLAGIAGIEPRGRLAAAGSNSPLIFMTAIDDEATRKEAMKAGCVAYLKKPFAPRGKRWPSESADPADDRFAPTAVVQRGLHSARQNSFHRPCSPRAFFGLITRRATPTSFSHQCLFSDQVDHSAQPGGYIPTSGIIERQAWKGFGVARPKTKHARTIAMPVSSGTYCP